jgi:hypothetical protein
MVRFRDIGLPHMLMGVPTLDALLAHPRSGSSWEGAPSADAWKRCRWSLCCNVLSTNQKDPAR